MDEMTPKYSEWIDKYTFDNCAVGRKPYGEFLASFLSEEKDGFVLNLDGRWGTGKTEFLKRLYTHFYKEEHPVIYIDAWESDFTDNPLLVVASELLNQLSQLLPVDGEDIDKLKKYLGTFLKGSAILAGSLVGKHLLDDAAGGREFVKTLFESSPQDLLDTMKKGYSEQVNAVKEVRLQLEQLAEALEFVHKRNLPVIVLVDELDRCRPNYAIEMLEVIKHFFSTKNFVFVVATDTEQLQNSIKAVYGEQFDSTMYLRRFFNRKAMLSPPDFDEFIQNYKLTAPDNVTLYPDNNLTKEVGTLNYHLSLVTKAYDLNLRAVDQITAKILSCLRVIAVQKDENHAVNIFALLVAIIEFDEMPKTFNKRGANTPLATWPLTYVDMEEIRDITIESGVDDQALKFSAYYALNMKHCVAYGDGINTNSTYQIGPSNYFYRNPISKLNREQTHFLLIKTDESIRNVMNGNNKHKIWLWDDYKDIVKLSHTLS